jgi:DNA-binding CsgD family transcriptional regulator
VTTLDDARECMITELAAAVRERHRPRIQAAAVWLRDTGTPLVDVYETLLRAAAEDLPVYAPTPVEHVEMFEIQEIVRDVVARLAPSRPARTRGQVLIVVPGGSRWVLGTAALGHVLEDAGFDAVTAPGLEIEDIEAVLDGMDDPVALCLALHEVAVLRPARDLIRRLRTSHPRLRVIVGGKASTAVSDLGSAVGAHAVTTRLGETLDALGDVSNPLSPRELAVLGCVARGMSNPDAGQHLGVAAATVKTHLDRVYAKLGTSDRTATVAMAMRRGWIE